MVTSARSDAPLAFGDVFAPPTLAQHEVLAGQASVLVDDRDVLNFGVPLGLRIAWLRQVHPYADIRIGEGRALPEEVRAESLALRADPVGRWSSLHQVVQGGLTIRVCVVGAESTGKTTLVDEMARRHATHRIGEYGRDYTVMKKLAGTNDHWDTADFVRIAREQQRLEDYAAVGAGPLLFCDTDAMTTALWHERYLGSHSSEVERIGRMRTYDLLVLCDIDIPWEADAVRLGAETRSTMHERFLEMLTVERTEPWVLVSGSLLHRCEAVEAEIARLGLLTPAAMYAASRWRVNGAAAG